MWPITLRTERKPYVLAWALHHLQERDQRPPACRTERGRTYFLNERTVMSLEALRKNGMMNRLLEALDKGKDIGHYGRLVFAMVARHFIEEEELIELLQQD